MRPNRRAEILDATASLIAQRGYHAASVGSVARAARVSRQAVYAHFGSKPRLLLALVERAGHGPGVVDPPGTVTEAIAPAALLDAALDSCIGASASAGPVLHALDAVRSTDADAATAWQTLLDDRPRFLH